MYKTNLYIVRKIFNLVYKDVNLENDTEVCINFRKDTFISSFGTLQRWAETSGENSEKYIQYLRLYNERDDHRLIHVWRDQEIIGQLEFKVQDIRLNLGYVNLFYLKPEYRGMHFSGCIHSFVVNELKSLGCMEALLSVSPTNDRAVRYYLKNGWNFYGKNKSDENVELYKIYFK